jgi:hypothetical protein
LFARRFVHAKENARGVVRVAFLVDDAWRKGAQERAVQFVRVRQFGADLGVARV